VPGRIHLLPETLTHRIAAGEVVERPASIVKELMENALDAGATEIVVALEKGGCESIRITDNGEGIAPEDVPLAFSRYATSKIGAFEDIYGVRSFGFRGEALPSIASIARVVMDTRQAASSAGTRAIVEAGEVRELSEVGCPVGTSLAVDRIFDPVPVRRKFLKSDLTEQGYCLDAITRLALAYPEVRIRAMAGVRELLQIPAVSDLAERIALTLGRDFRGQLVPADAQRDGVTLRGFVSRPEFTRSGTGQMYLYVNRRFVKDALLNHAVMTAYRRIIEPRRYPAVVIDLDLPAGEVDVNVHPAKLEVRFRNPREIYGLIVETLSRAIGSGDALPGAVDRAGTAGATAAYTARVEEALKRYRVFSGPGKSLYTGAAISRRESAPAIPADRPPAAEIPLSAGPGDTPVTAAGEQRLFSALVWLGQVAGTYLVFTGPQGLVLVDQHAAHEKIVFEKLRRQSAGVKELGQRLLLPEVMSLPPRDYTFLAESAAILNQAGIEVEPFGGDSLVVKTVPAFLSGMETRQLILDLIADCTETDRALPLAERRDRIFSALACQAAVKANRNLTGPEVAALCRDLDAVANAATCPHGRPLSVTFSSADLEKLFRRK
jgi:DNA mismatch repair protein MutL